MASAILRIIRLETPSIWYVQPEFKHAPDTCRKCCGYQTGGLAAIIHKKVDWSCTINSVYCTALRTSILSITTDGYGCSRKRFYKYFTRYQNNIPVLRTSSTNALNRPTVVVHGGDARQYATIFGQGCNSAAIIYTQVGAERKVSGHAGRGKLVSENRRTARHLRFRCTWISQGGWQLFVVLLLSIPPSIYVRRDLMKPNSLQIYRMNVEGK